MRVECCILHFAKVRYSGFLSLYRNLCVICIYTSLQYRAYIKIKIIFHIAIFYIVKTRGFKDIKGVVLRILHGSF